MVFLDDRSQTLWDRRVPALPPLPVPGDAADYGALVRQGEFGVRTPHIGYYIVCYPVGALAAAIGVSTTMALAVLAAACVALAVTIANLFYRDLGFDRSTSYLGSLILGSTGIIWYHAEFEELQALLMLSIIASLTAYGRGRPILAAAICALFLLTSQATAAIGLCFLVMAYWRRSWSLLVRFSLAFAVFFGMGLAPIAQD